MVNLSKSEVQKTIKSFFEQGTFSSEEMKKIFNLAMKHRIRLGTYRSRFCKKCYTRLTGSLRITRDHKTIICSTCGFANKIRIS